jgi:alpha-2-macroglobulin
MRSTTTQALLLAAATLVPGLAQAFVVEKFSPQGDVARVRQVQARFNEAMVTFGNAAQPAPFGVSCSEPGRGRWLNERTWIYDFERDVPVATRCSFALKSDLKALSGSANTGTARFAFSTGGPAVVNTFPQPGSVIEEQQAFVIVANGPVDANSVASHVTCASNKVGEVMATTLVPAGERQDILDNLAERLPGVPADALVVLRCQRPLPEDASVTLTWSKGVQTPGKVKALEEQRLQYKVRPAFRVSFGCEREQANKPCIPMASMRVDFSSPVNGKLAMALQLKGGGKTLEPVKQDGMEEGAPIESVEFAAPFPENTEYTLSLPKGFADESGRAPANAASFPLKVGTGYRPPLAKFSARFGIVEREADGAAGSLPVTVRNIEAEIKGTRAQLATRSLATQDDAQVLRWLRHAQFDSDNEFATRTVSHLQRETSAAALPALKTQRALEVIGIALAEPGLHAVEIESRALGSALLGEDVKDKPMYVRSLALHTGMAVHFKTSPSNAAVWVTSLSTGRPVAGAELRVSDCTGKELWRGKTAADGTARIDPALKKSRCDLQAQELASLHPQPKRKGDQGGASPSIEPFLFVSARTADDYSFALSNWSQGIEPWRFDMRTAGEYDEGDGGESTSQGHVAHTVFDRTLLRAGETVHMKHFLRLETLAGLARPPAAAGYDNAVLRHLGSDQNFTVPLQWLGTSSATSDWKIPETAKLGMYSVTLTRSATNSNASARQWPAQLQTGTFQVAQFRLPVMQGVVSSKVKQLVAPQEVPLALQLNYLNGGAAAGENVTVSALLRPTQPRFKGYEAFRFDLPTHELDESMRSELGLTEPRDQLVADKTAATLDKQGSASVNVSLASLDVPLKQPATLRSEMNYRDPNGEIQSIAANIALWPSAVVLGVKNEEWFGEGSARKVQFVVLDTAGKPVKGTRVVVQGISRKSFSVRKRTVGGFYTYDNRVETSNLGTVCEGQSDELGLVFCELSSRKHQGNLVLIGQAADSQGHTAYAGTSMWLGRSEYFAAEDSDRMDVLPQKTEVQSGETVKLQVRLPFHRATAWVAVEREGVIDSFTVELSRDKPEISLPIKAEYAPNVYVSVLAVRPRIREAPWWSFFTWGWRSPREWWASFQAWDKPTSTVDLAKPAYRLGVTELQVGRSAQTIAVKVNTTQSSYQTRAQVRGSVQLLQPDGKPVAAGSSVVLAVVDEALLELRPNKSWELLEAMWRPRAWAVETATAQMQVIGKRHFGQKALPPGGGGGRSPTRELLDTLVYWNANAVVGANGEVPLDFTLNDALSKFRVVAIAEASNEAGQGWFGTGSANIVATKDLQIIAGLPPLVREGDQFAAMATLRNTTQRAMKVTFTAQREDAPAVPPFAQSVDLAAGASQLVRWPVTVDEQATALRWKLDAVDSAQATINDSLRSTQRVVPAVPVTTWQATLMQVEQSASLPVQAPPGALPGRGGLRADLQASLVGSLAPVRRWFEAYPYSCLEQRSSRAIGLRDDKLWAAIGESLPNYLDADGLARYFPDDAPGSDTLTAYLLAASHEAGWLLPKASLDRMSGALTNFVEGKLKREFWSPRKDLDVRKLAAIEALSRYGKAKPALLSSVNITPQNWPTSAVIDWYSVLQRLSDVPDRDKKLAEALQILRARLDLRGTKLAFSDERGDYWWWLMGNSDVNAARLLLAGMNTQPGTSGISEWLQDMPRLVNGLIARQQKGVWMTTTANVWAALAVEKYASGFERDAVGGTTTVALAEGDKQLASQSSTWSAADDKARAGAKPATVTLPWPTGSSGSVSLNITHQGSGKPYAVLQSLAAVPMSKEDFAGYQITRSITPITQKTAGKWSVGDVYRVKLEVQAQADMTWVVVSDPVPAGATVLGSGLARDSQIETRKERSTGAWAAFEERTFEGFRAYYGYLAKGNSSVEYTVRLNQPGDFALPPTRVEAMYAPDMYGALPNERLKVE